MFLAGNPIKETLFLTDGRVKITQLGENGTEVILRLTSPGDVIGDLGLVPGCARHFNSTGTSGMQGTCLGRGDLRGGIRTLSYPFNAMRSASFSGA